jgi:hypothetical protein
MRICSVQVNSSNQTLPIISEALVKIVLCGRQSWNAGIVGHNPLFTDFHLSQAAHQWNAGITALVLLQIGAWYSL